MVNRKSSNRKLLYHLLPAVFWLLAIGGSLVPLLPILPPVFPLNSYLIGYAVAPVVLLIFGIIGRIKRHTDSVEECFQASLLLGVASYWLPTIVFMIIPIWGYLIYQNLFSLRSFASSLIGFGLVAIWMVVLTAFSFIHYPLTITHNACAWIPFGAAMIAWLASTIARRILRVR